MDGFTIIAEPSRRAILDRLRAGEREVGELAQELSLSQPLVSKHLAVLRGAGLVTPRVAGRRRVYRLADRPLSDVLTWLAPYARRWEDGFERLAAALDEDGR